MVKIPCYIFRFTVQLVSVAFTVKYLLQDALATKIFSELQSRLNFHVTEG